MIRTASLSLLCSALLAACVATTLDKASIETVRNASWEPEPACFLDFNECDADGGYCRLVRRDYADSDGVAHTWDACNAEYGAWLDRLKIANMQLRKRDPLPQCFRASGKMLSAMGADPGDPDALLQVA